MQLDRLAVQLRMRNPWEAVDLGFAMVRTWARPVYAAWLVAFVPLCALALLLPWPWAIVLVWWLKPVLDRIVLHVLAAGVFGELPRLRDTLRALPRAITPGLLASLAWYRLFLARSFNLPVWQLERQTGGAARQRRRQLQRRTSSQALGLTFVCIGFEAALALSSIALIDLLAPVLQSDEFQMFQLLAWDDQAAQRMALTLIVFTAMAIVEPFYVAGGFALYLNRRSALEGWDLEVALRRMGERALAAARGIGLARAAASVMLLAGMVALQLPGQSNAQELAGRQGETAVETQAQPPAAPVPPAQRRAAREIKEILERPEFQEFRQRTGLEYFGKLERPKPRRGDSPGWATFIDALAQFLRILAYAGIGLAVVFLTYYLLRRFDLVGSSASSYVPPDTLFGLDVRPDSLPDDVAAAALELARSGELVKALSLLYRASLVTLLHRDGVELASGDTEEDCLRKSRQRIAQPSVAYLARLLSAWQRLAYARREVPRAEVEALCGEWPSHFRAANAGTAA